MRKVSKIVALFLHDPKADNEVHRASLKFLKTAIAFLTAENIKQGDLMTSVLSFFKLTQQKRSKHLALVKKIIGKLIRKVGSKEVKKAVPEKERPLVEWIERERRKRENKRKRERLLALLGQGKSEEAAKLVNGAESSDDDDESDSDLEEN